MATVDQSLELGAGTERIPPVRKAGLTLVGFGGLLFLVALFGEGLLSPLRIFVVGLGSVAVGLVLFYSREAVAPTTVPGVGEQRALLVTGAGFLFMLLSLAGLGELAPALFFWLGTGAVVAGALFYFRLRHGRRPAGIDNHGLRRSPTTARGAVGWILGILFTGFYVLLYWFPSSLEGLTRTMDPLSWMLRGKAGDQWFLYGTFYTLAVLTMGVRALLKYRHSRYQRLRTASVMFVQLGFAFVLPSMLVLFNNPEYYFSYFWPLDYDLFYPWNVKDMLAVPGGLGLVMLFWGSLMTFVATPVLTYFYGKRWYCSWVCGCGGLAETLGDPFRQLSDKSVKAWQLERWLIHSVLVFITVTTALLWVNSATEGAVLGSLSQAFSRTYGFLVGSIWAGVIGVGFYPLMGSRMWCRYGCPMAAILGLFQKYFSRFRITTNGGQCISCGNCSTYCEMGIDVRWYAQRGQNIIRASCVGCGVCSAVCPRGVLNLENGPREGRYNGPTLITRETVDILPD